jgi:nicotine blue oxidoreductase
VKPAGLVLAAGEGRRFGSPKAMLRLGADLLVDRAANTLHDAGCEPVVVVLGAGAADVVAAARLDRSIVVVNDAWADGMGSSLRCGLAALADLRAPAVVVTLVDQPLVTAQVVGRIIAEWQPGRSAVVASYDGKPRNPVLLDASIWGEVSASATGDVGARGWLRAHPDEVLTVACDDLGSDTDIDTPEDLTQFLEDPT